MANELENRRKQNIFTQIGKTLTATSLGLQGKDPSSVFDDIDQVDPLRLIAAKYLEDQIAKKAVEPRKTISQDTADISPNKSVKQDGINNNGVSSTMSVDPSSMMSMIPEDEMEVRISSSGGLGVQQTRKSEKEQDIMAKVAEKNLLGPIDLYQKKLEEEMKQGIAERPGDTMIKENLTDIETLSKYTSNVKLLDENFDDIANQLGPLLTGAPIFRTIARYTDDALANSFVGSIGQGFDVYRKAITGAQAGLKEIDLLKKNVPSENDRPITFLTKSFLGAYTTENALRRQIPVLRSANKSTAFLEAALQQAQDTRRIIGNILERRDPSVLKKIQDSFIEQGIEKADDQPNIYVDEDAGTGFSSYLDALEAKSGR